MQTRRLITLLAGPVGQARRLLSSVAAPYAADKLVVTRTAKPKAQPKPSELVFGKYFADHMLLAEHTTATGWAAPRIEALHDLTLAPSALCLHYGLECFEGMKAFRGVDGHVRLFRPDLNMQRLAKSCTRLTLPAADPTALLATIAELVRVDQAWIPAGRGFSLYIRPTVIATQKTLGVGPSDATLLFVITSPVGPYFAAGFKPISLLADSKYVRSWHGGVGDAKCGGNYAPTILPQREAAAKGCNQVLWLLGQEETVTEAGVMNFFMHWTNEQGESELITAPLDGTILAGVTRQAVLDLATQWGEVKVTQGYFTMPQVARALREGRVHEIFGTGTAATIAPVGEILYNDDRLKVPLALTNSGALAKRFTEAIFDIQYGDVKDHAWAPVIA